MGSPGPGSGPDSRAYRASYMSSSVGTRSVEMPAGDENKMVNQKKKKNLTVASLIQRNVEMY